MTPAGDARSKQPEGGVVVGQVTVGGHPQAEATVMIVEGHADHPDIAALTNEHGVYQLGGLSAGWYNIEARFGEQTARRSVELALGAQVQLDIAIG